MKKRYVQMFILVCFFSSIIYAAPSVGLEDENYRNIKNKTVTEETEEVVESTEVTIEQNESLYVTSASETTEEELIADKIIEAHTKLNELSAENSMEWFKKYKEIQCEYSEWIDTDETIYDVFSESELDLLFRIVETEVRGDTYFDEKANVCSVIFNRLYDQNTFHDLYSLSDVITKPSQFSSYSSGAYKKVTVTETTRLACEYAFQIGDTTDGALWFDSTNGNSWADSHREFIFKDSVGHSFYR